MDLVNVVEEEIIDGMEEEEEEDEEEKNMMNMFGLVQKCNNNY